MNNTFKGFLPWILFAILISFGNKYDSTAALAAFIITLWTDWQFLKQKIIFSWATALFFLALTINDFFIKQLWIMQNANLLSNAMLALIAIFSLIINRPFTLQYAKQEVPKIYWQSPVFLTINQLITAVWAICLLINTLINIGQIYFPVLNSPSNQWLTYIPYIIAVTFTARFPDWYTERFWQKRRVPATDVNPGLTGNLAPVTEERDITDLKIIGKIPDELSGVYLRNGPNSLFPPISYTYPFDGDGMIHAVYIHNGQARYRNRFVETSQLKAERRAQQALYGGIQKAVKPSKKFITDAADDIPIKNGRFIHIIRHANHYLALHESTSAYELTADLQTLQLWNPTQNEPIPLNAHTHVDHDTGELFAFTYYLQSDETPKLTAYVIDAQGKLARTLTIPKTHATMQHDFAVTKNHLIFFDHPVLIDVAGSVQGKPIFSWQPELGGKIGVVAKNDETSIFWLATEPFFVYHFANAYETDQQIVIDYVRYPYFALLPQDTPPAALHRMTINLSDRTLTDQSLDNQNIEFPRINHLFDTKPHQFIYALTHQANNNSMRGIDEFNALLKYDVKNNTTFKHYFGEDYEIGEPVFAPRPHGVAEDDGFILLFAYHKMTQLSELVILDAQQLPADPIARIMLSCRVPGGLHGSWLPDTDLTIN